MAKSKAANAMVGMPAGYEDKWQAEEDLRCFERCAEVKRDPKRVKRVLALAKDKQKSLEYVMGEAKEKKGEV